MCFDSRIFLHTSFSVRLIVVQASQPYVRVSLILPAYNTLLECLFDRRYQINSVNLKIKKMLNDRFAVGIIYYHFLIETERGLSNFIIRVLLIKSFTFII